VRDPLHQWGHRLDHLFRQGDGVVSPLLALDVDSLARESGYTVGTRAFSFHVLPGQKVCQRRDSNPHTQRAPAPKAGVSAVPPLWLGPPVYGESNPQFAPQLRHVTSGLDVVLRDLDPAALINYKR